jgi:hypothetical protein
VTDDDRAARYMAWMGLGGTPVNIPVALLEIVAVTKVLDQNRVLEASSLSANMLSQAKSLCVSLLGPDYTGETDQVLVPARGGYLDSPKLNRHLIVANGDAELWLRVCSIANPPAIHVLGPDLRVFPTVQGGALSITNNAPGMLVAPDLYPAGQPVGNAAGGVESYEQPCQANADCPGGETCDTRKKTCTNLWPWCVDPPTSGLPACPQAVVQKSHACVSSPGDKTCFEEDAANRWAVRGAINAGFAIFLYAQSIERTGPAPDFNQCNLLPGAGPK